MIWSAIIGQLVEHWLLIAGALGILAAFLRGKASARAEERDYAMKRMIRRSQKRTEIEDAIDQDTDLVRRAHASGVVVRHTEH